MGADVYLADERRIPQCEEGYYIRTKSYHSALQNVLPEALANMNKWTSYQATVLRTRIIKHKNWGDSYQPSWLRFLAKAIEIELGGDPIYIKVDA